MIIIVIIIKKKTKRKKKEIERKPGGCVGPMGGKSWNFWPIKPSPSDFCNCPRLR